jgi:two-component system sensor histidine kinase/response regulator
MSDKSKTKKQLVNELTELRQRVAELETLAAKYRETEEALSQCRAELEARYEELDGVARALSQDLRGALGLIISFVQVLKEYHAALTGEELHRYLGMIAQKGHKAINVIDELLEERTERPPDSEIEIGPLDTARAVAGALEILTYMVEEHRAQIILPPAGAWPVALGYGPWIEEVWFNYLSNAIQYGGRPPRVELGFDVSPPRPELGTKAQPNGATEQADSIVRFWIRDNGDGLTPEEQERLFTPFVRREEDLSKGYGLGLVVVRRIVERLGGQVGVESEGVPGRGSLFFFTLPLAK